ncbi:UPF0489 family protein [Burkholderia cenocepacia]|uniref:UPF0489 family protein n=1 Tax=Burkholderia cenocepacia TaxID=95486 RepID=UPI001CF17BEC|nr:UPF0489 family protein [Burkholderia cenocepacia]MCA7967344.1 UPF0489 family protein [Burkholderia cenocepacia]
MFHDKMNIGGKDVYIVESHQSILESWAAVRRNLPAAPALLTLDHHTDTHPPFLGHRFRAAGGSLGTTGKTPMDALLPGLLNNLDYKNEKSVLNAIFMLGNDEHITTAIEAGIVSRAFVINHMSSRVAYLKIYATTAACTVECQKVDHSDCQAKHSAQMLESVYLDRALIDLNTKAQRDGAPAVEAEPYILDIDLDYFHAETSIEPANTATFYRLVKNAVAVTIAKESTYVLSCRDEGSTVSAAALLERMKQHIGAAMA